MPPLLSLSCHSGGCGWAVPGWEVQKDPGPWGWAATGERGLSGTLGEGGEGLGQRPDHFQICCGTKGRTSG